MNQEIQNRIAALNESDMSFVPEWTLTLYEQIQDIMSANSWKCDEVLENLPPKMQTVYLLVALTETIANDGFFSVFYNESFVEIQRLRMAIKTAGFDSVFKLFDEALQLIQNKFQWMDENDNFIGLEKADPFEYFGDEITDRMEVIENQLDDILSSDDFENKLEKYMESES